MRAPPNNKQLKVTHMAAKDGDFRAPGASLKFEFGTGSATCGDNVTLSTWVFDFAKGKSRMPTKYVSNMRVRMSELHSRGAYGICKDETVWNMEGGDKCNANEGHGRCRIEPQHNGLDMTDMENNVWPASMMPTLGQFDASWFLTASALHVVLSVLVGTIFVVALPMMPKRPLLAGGVIAPVIWTGVVFATIRITNPVLEDYISWPWFIASRIAFGLACASVIARFNLVRLQVGRSLADRLELEQGRKGGAS